MKKNGFTLVELIGVLVILGLIATFSVPALTKTMKDSSEKQYNEYLKNITLAAENYFHSETDGTLNGKYFIKIKTLYDSGYLKKEKNPKTNEDTNENATVMISKNEDGTEKYELLELDATETGYASDGLLVHYDGYHKPENNVWNDLSGNGNNGVLYNFNSLDVFEYNSIYFNGSDYISNINNNPLYSDNNKLPDMTVEVILKKTISSWGNVLSFNHFVNENNTYMDLWTTLVSDSRAYEILYGVNNNGGQSYKIGWEKYPLGSIIKISYSKKDNLYKTYVNDEEVDSVNLDNMQGFTTNSFKLGTAENGYNFTGHIYSVRIYNRALTDEEIKNNYNVDKYRFDV